VLVVEELNHALSRNAKIYCEIAGFGSFGDAYHLTKPMENGEGGYRAMIKCLVEAKAMPAEIDMINCHATSTEVGDLAELNAIKNLFGNKKLNEKSKLLESFENFAIENIEENSDFFDKENLKKLILSANKTFIGHLLGAAGSVESIFSILSLKNNHIVNNINTKAPVSDNFEFNYGETDFRKMRNDNEIKYVIKNSFAFGGVNSAILFKKFQDK
jgi:3-oxoacyl-(acyl-carrier-protein) synthase